MKSVDFAKNNIVILAVLAIFAFWYISNLHGSLLYDEGAYAWEAKELAQGQLNSNDLVRPFVKYFFAISTLIFGPDDFWLRMVSTAFALAAIFAAYLIAKKLSNKTIGIITAILLGSNYFFASHAVRAMLDTPLIFLLLSAFYCTMKIIEKPASRKYPILLGFFSAAALATKIYSVFFISVFVMAIILKMKNSINPFLEKFMHIFSKKSIFLVLISGIFLGVFLQNNFLFAWDSFGIEKQGHALGKLPAITFLTETSIYSMAVFIIAGIVLNFALWILFSAIISFISKAKPKEAGNYCSVAMLSNFLLIFYFIFPKEFKPLAVLFWFFAILGLNLFAVKKFGYGFGKNSFTGHFLLSIVVSFFAVYLPFLGNFMKWLLLFIYDTVFMVSKGIDPYVMGQRLAEQPWWSYLYWLFNYGGIILAVCLVLAIIYSMLVFAKKAKPSANHWLLFFSVLVPLVFLSLISTKVPRYLLPTIAFATIFATIGSFCFFKKFIERVYPNLSVFAEKISFVLLILLIVLPGMLLPFPLEKSQQLLQNVPAIDKSVVPDKLPFYFAEWGISNITISPITDSLKFPDIHVDSGLEKASSIIREYSEKNSSEKVVVLVAWNPYNILQYYFSENVPKNAVFIDAYSVSPEFLAEKISRNEIDLVISLPADPQGNGLSALWNAITLKKKKSITTEGYAFVYFLK